MTVTSIFSGSLLIPLSCACYVVNLKKIVYLLGLPGSADVGKKKILLLKGKEKEIPHVSFYFYFILACFRF